MLNISRLQDMTIAEDTIKKLHHYQRADAEKAGRYRSQQFSKLIAECVIESE